MSKPFPFGYAPSPILIIFFPFHNVALYEDSSQPIGLPNF